MHNFLKACRTFFHDVLEWHTPDPNVRGFDGCSITSKCTQCGKTLLQDSQGGWS